MSVRSIACAGFGSAGTLTVVGSKKKWSASGDGILDFLSVPSGTATGDYLFAFVASDSSGTWTAPAGWTELVDQGATPSVACFYAVYSSGSPPSLSFTHSVGGSSRSGVLVSVRASGGAPLTPVAGTVAAGSGSFLSIPSFSTGFVDVMLSLVFCAKNETYRSMTISSSAGAVTTLETDADAVSPSAVAVSRVTFGVSATPIFAASVGTSGPAVAGVAVAFCI